MSLLHYFLYKILAALVRTTVSLRRGFRPLRTTPDATIRIPSRELPRTIKAHLYRSTATGPSPVLVNFHGSGFVLPMHGSDEEFCRLISRQTAYTVVDVQYRLAPEHPFPAAYHDAEDAVRWVFQQRQQFDRSRVAVSGFSAGGNLALGMSSLPPKAPPIHATVAFYPVVDLATSPGAKFAPDPKGRPLPKWLMRFFDRCYVRGPFDTRDPRISPFYAEAQGFPRRVLIVTAAGDSLAEEAEALGRKIRERVEDGDGKNRVVVQRMQGCNHGWDKEAGPGSVGEDAKDKAYAMAVALLT
ncbi:putative esterase/lipase [Aspergillus campestris IBT 28561]|uniref:Esterase/lipase n=1 Tax=Aspergillus campestris (strain IBT 28561) TaxID=1392248 RepID=A0A2I1DDC9_ASPC2|nr:putative esterase/lipase [Aspergillus campestris IBT 28561]PKY07871.1 putative esterase/lipase [Aspergillus campestris IBT 28561]